MSATEAILPGFTPTPLQQAAIDRIREYQQELKSYGMYVRTALELEFMIENTDGHLVPVSIDTAAAKAFLKEDEKLPNVESLRDEAMHPNILTQPELAAQYEVSISDEADNPLGTQHNPRQFSPLAVAASTERLKTGTLERMLHSSTCLSSLATDQRQLLRPSFVAQHPEADETSALHINISLYDKGGRNMFGLSRHLLHHCTASLIELQKEAALSMLPGENSLERIGSNVSAPAFIGAKADKYTSSHGPNPSINLRNDLLNGNVIERSPDYMRIESRLGGADADPFVATAIHMAALVDALRRHVRKTVDGETHKVRIQIDEVPQTGQHERHDISRPHTELVKRFEASQHARDLLGEPLYDEILKEYGKGTATARA